MLNDIRNKLKGKISYLRATQSDIKKVFIGEKNAQSQSFSNNFFLLSIVNAPQRLRHATRNLC